MEYRGNFTYQARQGGSATVLSHITIDKQLGNPIVAFSLCLTEGKKGGKK
jgi:hypothetical protein